MRFDLFGLDRRQIDCLSSAEKYNVITKCLETEHGLSCLGQAMREPIRRYSEFHFASRPALVVNELPSAHFGYNSVAQTLILKDWETKVKTHCLKATCSVSLPASFNEIDRMQIKLADDLQAQEESLVFDALFNVAETQKFRIKKDNTFHDMLTCFNLAFRSLEKNDIHKELRDFRVENIFASDKTWKNFTECCLQDQDQGAVCGFSQRDVLTNRQYGILWTSNLRACNRLRSNEYLVLPPPSFVGSLYIIEDITVELNKHKNHLVAEAKETIAIRLEDSLFAVKMIIQEEK